MSQCFLAFGFRAAKKFYNNIKTNNKAKLCRGSKVPLKQHHLNNHIKILAYRCQFTITSYHNQLKEETNQFSYNITRQPCQDRYQVLFKNLYRAILESKSRLHLSLCRHANNVYCIKRILSRIFISQYSESTLAKLKRKVIY